METKIENIFEFPRLFYLTIKYTFKGTLCNHCLAFISLAISIFSPLEMRGDDCQRMEGPTAVKQPLKCKTRWT